MGDNDQQRDPLGDVINMLAAPIAGGIRSVEQFRRGIEELFRTIDNLNTTLATINEAAARVNRFMSDVEEPVRAILPQLTRTVNAADELIEVVGAPARRIAPNLVQIADTLGSPAFTTLPSQINDFIKVMADVSRRLGPLAQFAESAGGMFGLRLPGSSRPAEPPREAAAPPPPTPPATPLPAVAGPTARSSAKKSSAKKSTAKRSTAKAAAKKSAATRSSGVRTQTAKAAAATRR